MCGMLHIVLLYLVGCTGLKSEGMAVRSLSGAVTDSEGLLNSERTR